MYLSWIPIWTFKIKLGPNGKTKINQTNKNPTKINKLLMCSQCRWHVTKAPDGWDLKIGNVTLVAKRWKASGTILVGTGVSHTSMKDWRVFFPKAGDRAAWWPCTPRCPAVLTRCFSSLLPGGNWEAGLPSLPASVFWRALWNDVSLWVFCSARNPRHAGTRGEQDSACHSTAHYPDKK